MDKSHKSPGISFVLSSEVIDVIRSTGCPGWTFNPKLTVLYTKLTWRLKSIRSTPAELLSKQTQRPESTSSACCSTRHSATRNTRSSSTTARSCCLSWRYHLFSQQESTSKSFMYVLLRRLHYFNRLRFTKPITILFMLFIKVFHPILKRG